MGKITNRRSRTPNWSLDEKQYLLELIKEHKKVVVTKSNNGPNHSEEKDVVWNEILRQLTEKFGTKFSGFSIKKVKTQWQNMKRIAREEITLNGAAVQKYTRQSLEVCHILDLIKDDILKNENEPIISTDIEIKSETIDEDISQPSCSGVNTTLAENPLEKLNDTTTILESSGSFISEHADVIDADNSEDMHDNMNKQKSTFDMTKISYLENIINTLPFHRDLQEFLKFSTIEKEIKMESIREERQVVRAMRETAELNKIIAEQKLKHILWIKKQEMA
ncbi:uncharacterized protein LOC126781582 [Nymphalis io]|uniref:uncharacterized protein LOC126781582 n=1 Tax=Inachis io TaxID=171585 RepID=UPI00216A57FF|nr:uncharacterized protein LOC126781582 [Nymphalis io]